MSTYAHPKLKDINIIWNHVKVKICVMSMKKNINKSSTLSYLTKRVFAKNSSDKASSTYSSTTITIITSINDNIKKWKIRDRQSLIT